MQFVALENISGAGKLPPWAKVLAAMAGDLSWLVDGEKDSYQLSSDLHACGSATHPALPPKK